VGRVAVPAEKSRTINAEIDTIKTEEREFNSVFCLNRVFFCVYRAAISV
jgi:hypothetical protein